LGTLIFPIKQHLCNHFWQKYSPLCRFRFDSAYDPGLIGSLFDQYPIFCDLRSRKAPVLKGSHTGKRSKKNHGPRTSPYLLHVIILLSHSGRASINIYPVSALRSGRPFQIKCPAKSRHLLTSPRCLMTSDKVASRSQSIFLPNSRDSATEPPDDIQRLRLGILHAPRAPLLPG
jgi:hypothetical protein